MTSPAFADALGLERRAARVSHVVTDTIAMAGRGLITYRRVPQLLVFSTIQPVVFVLMFRYVFGGAIRVPHLAYVDYLMPGIFVQTVTFGSLATGVGLATDLQTGFTERLRSLPMARSAVLGGRTLADLTRNVFVVALMFAVGYAVGFRIHAGVPRLIAALGIVLVFSYALSWVFATVGLAVANPETAQAAAFPVLAPLVFASSAFVPVSSMPSWLQAFANHQPVSVTVSAARALVLGTPATTPVWQSLAWSAVILAVAIPLSIRIFRRAV